MANANRTVWIELARITKNLKLRRQYLLNYAAQLRDDWGWET